jgi:hypothetical protein
MLLTMLESIYREQIMAQGLEGKVQAATPTPPQDLFFYREMLRRI